MRFSFEKLCEVVLTHNYYQTNPRKDFEIFPTTECQDLLRNYGLRFRPTASGFMVYHEVEKDLNQNTKAKYPIVEPVKFAFILKPISPYLLNYSELPFDGHNGHIYRLSNFNKNKQGSTLLLSTDTSSEFVTVADRIALRSQAFPYRIESGETTRIVLSDEIGSVIDLGDFLPNEGIIDYFVDVTRRAPGKFTLNVDGDDPFEFYASSEIFATKAFGVIEVSTDNTVPADYQFVDPSGAVSIKTFSAKFDNRKTLWKYLVHLKHRKDIQATQLSIQSTQDFTRQSELTLADGTKVVPFVSNEPIAFQDTPIKEIKLVRTNGANSETFEVKNLANASVRTLALDDLTNSLCSKIFVYV